MNIDSFIDKKYRHDAIAAHDQIKDTTHSDGNASKPHISKIYNVQETQKTVSKQTKKQSVCYLYFCHFYRLCIRILVQAIDTL